MTRRGGDLREGVDDGVAEGSPAAGGEPVAPGRTALYSGRGRPRGGGAPAGFSSDVVTSARIFLVGGLISFRALFNWLSPWIYVPSLLMAPIFQILLFAYIGRSAGIESDAFFVIGNAVQYSAIPCLFAMANTVAGERWTQTLGIVLSTPARRVPLFLGRSLPVVVNGFVVSMFSLVVGSLLLGVSIPASAWLPLALVVGVAAMSCTGLGLANAALGLRVRETAVLSNVLFGVLLIFCGVNVALDSLPGWMAAVGSWLPLTHAIEAARSLAAGGSLASVSGLVQQEIGLGVLYGGLGLVALRLFEIEGRRRATLEIQ
ncbi:ABC transporter permease [Nocardioides mesophilus]|uniref:Transport permease protein n=1 Tax=Nocardioides mesophilus TaxID=433659 RepID=A0A7G9RE56_9ACTN|nr:ABC transporter permease [Nocardioides mesophilus]QNN53881.1 ABC transporter permease [Nocardioides mesophilus]